MKSKKKKTWKVKKIKNWECDSRINWIKCIDKI